jgi:hypothetical protein
MAVGLAFVSACRVAVEYTLGLRKACSCNGLSMPDSSFAEEHHKLSGSIVLTQLGSNLRFAQTPGRDGVSEACHLACTRAKPSKIAAVPWPD